MTVSSPSCAAHPDVVAPWVCQECKKPLCDACRVKIQGKSACGACADAIRSRTGAQIESGGSGVAASTSTVAMPRVIVPDSPAPARMFLGILIATAVGLAGAIIWEKIAFYTGRGWLYFFPVVGFFVGFCLVYWGKREGSASGLIAVAIYTGTMLYGHHLLVIEQVTKELRNEGLPADLLKLHPTLRQTWPLIKSGFSFLHWALVAAGAIAAYVGALKLDRKQGPASAAGSAGAS